jgi:aminobenzoyl-glutamate transport protein
VGSTGLSGRVETTRLDRVLNGIERAGNRLPHPFLLFVYLAVGVMIVSAVVAGLGVTVEDPGSGDTVAIRSLFSGEGVQFILEETIENFTGFPPLGLVLGLMLGIGLADKAGLLESAIRRTVELAPAWSISYVIFLIGIVANLASDAAFVIVPPLAALVFHSLGRHPIVGLGAGFAAVGAGFTANLIITGTDALLAGISTEAAAIVDSDVVVTPADNWYFIAASALILPLVGALLTDRVVERRFGAYTGAGTGEELQPLGDDERRGLRAASFSLIAFVAVIAVSVLPAGSPLRGEGGGLVESPFLAGIVPILLLGFVVVATAYGLAAGTIESNRDVPRFMGEAMKDLSGYIVLIFAAAQFIAYFEWSNLGIWVAVTGAETLEAIQLTGLGAIFGYVLLTAVLNLLIFSGSAQWALQAPIFIPLFMLLGYNPAFVQAAFRIADSSTNIITPLNPYLVVILGFMRDWDEDAGLGTLISTMLVYSIAFLGVWSVLLSAFAVFDIPFGPGVGTRLPS